MKDIIYITFNKKGYKKTTKSYPATNSDEIVVKLNFNLNDHIFNKPRFESNIEINNQTSFDISIQEAEKQIETLRKQGEKINGK